MDFFTQTGSFFYYMGVNRAEVPNLIAELLAVLAIFNGDLPIRVYNILDPTIKLDLLMTFLLDLPVLFVCNRQELLYEAA
jgi:hypothetical protein